MGSIADKGPQMTDEVRNDSNLPTQSVIDYLAKHGTKLEYGKITLAVTTAALDDTRKLVREWSPAERQHALASVDRALRAAIKKVRAQTASKKRMDNFYEDLLLWTALKEMASQ